MFVGEGVIEGNWTVGEREIVSVFVGVTVRSGRIVVGARKEVGDNNCAG